MIKDAPEVIKPALQAVQKGFKSGKTRPISYRKEQLKSLIKGIRELTPKFHAALLKDLGVNEPQSLLFSVTPALDEIEATLHNIDKWTAKQKTDIPVLIGPGNCYIKPEPLGVALVVGPWNYPVSTFIPYVGMAIAAGNACIGKPSELAPHTSNVMAELFDKYLDKDCYRCIEGQVEVAKAIVKEPFDLYVFTGSTEKGKIYAKAAAEHLAPCILELGGKCPTVVDEYADLDSAALRIMQGRFLNCGQTCIACDYVFVNASVKAKLVEKFKQVLVKYYGEDPHKSKDYARLISDFHVKRLKSYLDENHGGKVIVGGTVKADEKYIAPTLVDSPKPTSLMMTEEIFGPILPIYEFEEFDQVLTFINSRPKPLAVYYYGSGSHNNYKRLIEETSSGNVTLNDSVVHFAIAEAPFGGVGHSGYGKLHGHEGFKSMSNYKSVFEKGNLNVFPLNIRFPPYTPQKQKVLNFAIKYSYLSQGFMTKVVLFWFLLVILFVLLKRGYVKQVLHIVGNVLTKAGKDL